ncbi:hypothetical protein BH23ACT8_BH23ACT8_18670 [soil metagenome]
MTACLLAIGMAPAASGQEEVDPDQALLLTMDSSGSMAEPDALGGLRIDGAKDALRGVVDALPDELPTGMRVYGHQFDASDQAHGCADTELIAPVEPLDRCHRRRAGRPAGGHERRAGA